jgi:uncharacterized protein with HEPN domain
VKDQSIYLLDILTHLERIVSYARAGRDEFMQSTLLQDAILRNFEIIGEAVKQLIAEVKAKQPHIPWRKIAASVMFSSMIVLTSSLNRSGTSSSAILRH